MKLEEIKTGTSLAGVEPTHIVSVVATVPLGEGSIQLIYRTPDGAMKERLLARADEQGISVATTERPFSFDGDGACPSPKPRPNSLKQPRGFSQI